MGKGYNNYMCKKPFHPGSKANIKRAWMAEQKTENEKRKQEELKVQYEKEQNLYTNKAMISSESKDKLELNFMYEAPPGAKRERQKEDDEPEYKFEWQRKYNAPREDYAKGNEDIKDQPFGIPVRNVRCIKCHKWGHINTDKECPLYNQASTSAMPTTSMDPMELMKQMKEDGYGLKEHVLGHQLNPTAANQQFIASDESDPEMEFLKSLSTSDKKKLLRKLKKLSKKQEKKTNCKKKKSKKSKKSSEKGSSSDSEKEVVKKKKKHKRKSSSSESDSSSSDHDSRKKKKKKIESKSSKETVSKIKAKKSAKNLRAENSDSSYSNVSDDTSKSKEKSTEKPSEMGDKTSTKSNKISPKKHVTIKTEKRSVSPAKNETVDPKYSHISAKVTVKEEKLESPEEIKQKTQKSDTNSKQSKPDVNERDGDRKRKTSTSQSEEGLEEKKLKCVHPDGFSHNCPQTRIEDNYILPEEEYKGEVHDKFRHRNRDKRSPSVKQKYNC